ncbi:transposase [Streptomyces sp. NPDC002587]
MGSNYAKRYSDEYKRDAVELVRSSGRTVTEVARQLGISPESLRAWVNQDRTARHPLGQAAVRRSCLHHGPAKRMIN